jgi:hypothetical protein
MAAIAKRSQLLEPLQAFCQDPCKVRFYRFSLVLQLVIFSYDGSSILALVQLFCPISLASERVQG